MPDTPTGEDTRGPAARRRAVRLITVYATPWHLRAEHREPPSELSDHLRLGRMAGHFAALTTQTPQVLHRAELTAGDLRFGRQGHARPVTEAGLWLFVTTPGQIIVAFSLDLDTELIDTIDLLEECYYLEARYGETPIESVAAALAERYGVDTSPGVRFLPDRHQIVLGPALPGGGADDVLQRVVYRSDLPHRHEFSTIGYPPELNRRPGTAAAVGPSVSVLCGHEEFVENAALLSLIQAVASAAWLRDIHDKAFSAMETFRVKQRALRDPRERRRVLARLSSRLGDLELDLSYGVEACAGLALMMPSLRVAGYHNALYAAMGLMAKAEMVARMLRRLERAVDAELMAIESIERRIDENHRIRWAVAVGFVSIVPVPIGLIFAFFGMNTPEVDRFRSIWDMERYLPLYLFTTGLIALGVLIFVAFYLYQRLSLRRELRNAPRNDD